MLAIRALLIVGLGFFLPVTASVPIAAVCYPDMGDPYRGIFLGIVAGIENGLGSPVRLCPLKTDENLSFLAERLRQEGVEVVITLGRRGLQAAQTLADSLPVVIGSVPIAPDSRNANLSAISLTPDPDEVFAKLVELNPAVKRIVTVYHPEQDGWIIERAHWSAKQRGIGFEALPARDIKTAAGWYAQILQTMVSEADALWLLQNDISPDENALLPLILQKSWERRLLVFSNSPDDVRKGALFSLFPDNTGMGRSLAHLALKRLRQPPSSAMVLPLRDLLTAVNLRTAEHLGLRFGNRERGGFVLVFPQP